MYYALAAALVFAAIAVGDLLFFSTIDRREGIAKLSYGDGAAYAQIARRGYAVADWPPSVARLPAYPLLGRIIARLSGVGTETALVLVTHASLLAAFILVAHYLAARWPNEPVEFTHLTLLAAALWPSSFFFHAAYSESLFLFLAVLSLYAMERRWPTAVIAAVIGLATATRPVGVAIVAVFAWYLWQKSGRDLRALSVEMRSPNGSGAGNDATPWFSERLTRVGVFARRAILWIPFACWGIVAYMVYLQLAFDDALAFAQAHAYWVQRPTPWGQKAIPLLTLEPLWAPYIPGSWAYWQNFESANNPLLSFGFMNPLFFVVTVALVIVGAVKKWLNSREVLLAAALLAIPYFMMAYDNVMVSQLRFASIVFPAYLVLGRLLAGLPKWAIALFAVSCGALLYY
jgi:hypothetical protein